MQLHGHLRGADKYDGFTDVRSSVAVRCLSPPGCCSCFAVVVGSDVPCIVVASVVTVMTTSFDMVPNGKTNFILSLLCPAPDVVLKEKLWFFIGVSVLLERVGL